MSSKIFDYIYYCNQQPRLRLLFGVFVACSLLCIMGIQYNWHQLGTEYQHRTIIANFQNPDLTQMVLKSLPTNATYTTVESKYTRTPIADNVIVLIPMQPLNVNRTNVQSSNKSVSVNHTTTETKPKQHKFIDKLDSSDLEKVSRSLNSTWHFNKTAANQFRSLLSQKCGSSKLFLTTKKNVRKNALLRYVAARRKKINITQSIYDRLPKEMPLKQGQYKKCSIVGNSGILLGSKCGKSIDSADYVFRFALANTNNYSEDVGRQTDFVTVNPSLLIKEYSHLHKKGRVKLHRYIDKNYNKVMVFIAPFGFSFATEFAFTVQDTIESINTSVVFLHPEFTRLTNKFWKTHGINPKKFSTGFYIFTAAFAFCEELHLYGFWPFAEDLQGHALLYHYYNDYVQAPHEKHRMPVEFQKLFELHRKGIIHLHMDSC
ncbi:alpha-N-acetylneuraminide alpha-2,8-sialyltransferase-like [Glandiceps talaboti]